MWGSFSAASLWSSSFTWRSFSTNSAPPLSVVLGRRQTHSRLVRTASALRCSTSRRMSSRPARRDGVVDFDSPHHQVLEQQGAALAFQTGHGRTGSPCLSLKRKNLVDFALFLPVGEWPIIDLPCRRASQTRLWAPPSRRTSVSWSAAFRRVLVWTNDAGRGAVALPQAYSRRLLRQEQAGNRAAVRETRRSTGRALWRRGGQRSRGGLMPWQNEMNKG